LDRAVDALLKTARDISLAMGYRQKEEDAI